MQIPFHLPYISGKEIYYVNDVIQKKKLSGNGEYSLKCHQLLKSKWGFKKVLLTNSCTDALEMCALLLDIQPGDEIILPSYTFVSTATAFCNYGAIPIFVDTLADLPNIDPSQIEAKISSKTKAIIIMHYAGIACDMNQIQKIASKHNIVLIEDAALGFGSYYNGLPLGSFGDLATFSFHETKNITCGEGGMLVINKQEFTDKAEKIWEKGTNRASFLRKEINEYEWVSKGASFLLSEIQAAFLLAQLEHYDYIHNHRKNTWNLYFNELQNLPFIELPKINSSHQINGSIFFIIGKKNGIIFEIQQHLNQKKIGAVSHYKNLHLSKYYLNYRLPKKLINCELIENNILRLPIYPDLSFHEQSMVISEIKNYILNL